MRKLTAIFLCGIALSLSAQQLLAQPESSDFEEGTVILENGTEITTLIKVEKWNLSPDEVTIKRAEDTDPETLNIDQVQSFSIPAFVKFVRDTVQSDVSGVHERTMTETRAPVYEKRVVFLRVLVEGEASLYSYRNPIKEQFYYNKPGTELTHLVAKKYLLSPGRVAINNRYQQQLYTELRCGDVELNEMARINYEIDNLTKYFLSYNRCKGSEAVSFQRVDSQGEIKIYASAGLGISNLTYSRMGALVINSREVKFGNNAHIVLNAGIEWRLPFNSKEWSVLGNLGYHTFSSEKEYSYGSGSTATATATARVTYETSILNMIAELRRYFSSDNENSFFAGLAIGTSINTYEISGISMENTDMFTKQVSLGYLWDDSIFGKVTYTLPYSIERIDLKTLTLSIGFTL